MRIAGPWPWLYDRPWMAAVGSCGLHLLIAGFASVMMVNAPEFGMEAGVGGAGGASDKLELTATIELEEPPPVPEPVAVQQPLMPEIEPEAESEDAEIVLPVPVEAVKSPEPVPTEKRVPSAKAAPTTKPMGGESARVAEEDRGTGSGGVRTQPSADHLRNRPPPYPESARRNRQEGVVYLLVTVTAEGRASEVRLHRSSGYPVLDEAALNAVRRYRFKPATMGGFPVASTTIQPIRFNLKDAR